MISLDKRSEDNSESDEAIPAELPDATEATAAESSGVVEAIPAESPSLTTRKARKALRGGVSKGSAGAGSNPKISRELARLIRPDQLSRLVSTFQFLIGQGQNGRSKNELRGGPPG